MTRINIRGLDLNVEIAGSGPPLVLLHGFTGSAGGWRLLTQTWQGFATIAVDLIGHGLSDSPRALDRYRMEACVDDIAGVLDALDVRQTALLGYSMGGRTALHFALKHQERLNGLVLESAAPGYTDPAERSARIKSDEELADRIETDGIEAFVDYWQSLPLWASQRALAPAQRRALRDQRLQNSTVGLANSLRGMGAGAQEPVLDRLQEISVPTIFLAGALDTRYVELARHMCGRVVGSAVQIIENAGHAAHLEQPAAFSEAVLRFLDHVLATTTATGGPK